MTGAGIPGTEAFLDAGVICFCNRGARLGNADHHKYGKVMKIIETLEQLERVRAEYRARGETLALVPTMGSLHEGHLSLAKIAKHECDRVMVYIYINPAQFNNPADLESYPVDIDRDLQLLQARGVDAAFLPTTEMIYPRGFQSWVNVETLAADYEGAGRKGHFKGVSTVLSIMFHLVGADVAVFGEKDFQQLRVVEQMVEDLRFPMRIARGPLVRDHDGLALSSRNVRLDTKARSKALLISAGLLRAREAFRQGERDTDELERLSRYELEAHSDIEIHYCSLVDEHSLTRVPVAPSTGARLLITATVGGVRLLDNMPLTL